MAQNNELPDASYRRIVSGIEAHRNRLAEVMAGPDTLEVLPRYIYGVLSAEAVAVALQARPESPGWATRAKLWAAYSRRNLDLIDILVVFSQDHNVDISFIYRLPHYGSVKWRALFVYVRLLLRHAQSRDVPAPPPQPNAIDNGEPDQDADIEQDENTEQNVTPYDPETECPVCLLAYPRFIEFPCFPQHAICERCLNVLVCRNLVIACPLCRTIPFAELFPQ
ncbi:hypothetical protein DFH28DRAFT_1082837 [Melampsora americana]|nr:hypothetical protein DFH28DRAFT_1082837 [Melampsora americana]